MATARGEWTPRRARSVPVKLSSSGRGTSYTRLRGVVESALEVAYRGGWPARVWGRLPGTCHVHVIRRTFGVLPRGTPALRIGYASDLHAGPTTPTALLERAADALAEEELDVLLLGGDFVFLEVTPAKLDALERFVQRAKAKRTLAVLGNHDLWTHHHAIERALVRAGAELIVNRSVRLAPHHAAVAIVGLDDPWTGVPDAERAFHGADDAALRIVLCHSPDGVPLAAGRNVSLYCCGHTHGGHVAAPWGALYVPGPLGKTMSSGFHEAFGTRVFVSRGLGGIELPVRTFAPPDVAVFHLTSG